MYDAATIFSHLETDHLPTPCYVVDVAKLEDNLKLIQTIQNACNVHFLLALKSFSFYALAPLLRRYLAGTAASGLWEARLGKEKFGGQTHVFCTAFSKTDLIETLPYADHLIFNSPSQLKSMIPHVNEYKKNGGIVSVGLRINPHYSEVRHTAYDPCQPYSRLGTGAELLSNDILDVIEGVHFHNHCEHSFDNFQRSLKHIEKNFSSLIERMKWINFGGGHFITKPGYDVDSFIACLLDFKKRYDLDIYFEPGGGIVLNSGAILTEILDIHHNERRIGITDISAVCHIPEIAEMPYSPKILNACNESNDNLLYRLGGPSCLSTDTIGDYYFNTELTVGQRLTILDMAHYTHVRFNTFNGIKLPSLAISNYKNNTAELIRVFSYEDYCSRLS